MIAGNDLCGAQYDPYTPHRSLAMRSARLYGLLLVFTAACASSPGQTSLDTTVTPMTASMLPTNAGTLDVGATAEVTAIATALPIAPDSAYKLLRAAYAKLEIPVARDDSTHHSLGNDGLRARRQLGGLTMQTVLDCGQQIGLANAETWDIQMDILSYIVPDGHGGSQLWTRIQATGHDPSVSGRDLTPCSTRGELEAKIGNVVKVMAVG
jgi:hypothetical protein